MTVGQAAHIDNPMAISAGFINAPVAKTANGTIADFNICPVVHMDPVLTCAGNAVAHEVNCNIIRHDRNAVARRREVAGQIIRAGRRYRIRK